MDARLTELETKISYQEHLLGELNDVVTSQQRQIDRLERQLKRMGDHLKQMSGSGLARPEEEAPPPHY